MTDTKHDNGGAALCADSDLDALWDGIEALPGYSPTTGCAEFIRLATVDVLAKVSAMFRDRLGSSMVTEWFLADDLPDLRRIANPAQLRLACAHRALEIALGRSHRTGAESMYSRLRDYHQAEFNRAMASLVLAFRPAPAREGSAPMTTTELIEAVRQLCADMDAREKYIAALEAELRVLRGTSKGDKP